VGSRAEVEALAGPGRRVVDAGGRTLLPGFVESHLHLVLGGAELTHLQLGGVQGFEALARRSGPMRRRTPAAAADGAGGGL
jgi:predicted amidohydrolase YtcJ